MKEEIKDCFMCKRGEVYGDLNDPSICCGSTSKEHQSYFSYNGRFCACICKGYEQIKK